MQCLKDLLCSAHIAQCKVAQSRHPSHYETMCFQIWQAAASQRRGTARALLRHAAPLVEAGVQKSLLAGFWPSCFAEAATRDGLADLTHVSMLIETELQALDNQDAAARLAIGPESSPLADAQPRMPSASGDEGDIPKQPKQSQAGEMDQAYQATIPEGTQVTSQATTTTSGATATWRPR